MTRTVLYDRTTDAMVGPFPDDEAARAWAECHGGTWRYIVRPLLPPSGQADAASWFTDVRPLTEAAAADATYCVTHRERTWHRTLQAAVNKARGMLRQPHICGDGTLIVCRAERLVALPGPPTPPIVVRAPTRDDLFRPTPSVDGSTLS